MIDLSKAVKRALEVEFEETTNILKREVKKAADKAAEELKEASPKRRGKYAKGWKAKLEEKALGSEAIVHNDRHYRLTHLLEKGHQNRDGSRTKAQPHIGPVEEKIVEELERSIITELQRR